MLEPDDVSELEAWKLTDAIRTDGDYISFRSTNCCSSTALESGRLLGLCDAITNSVFVVAHDAGSIRHNMTASIHTIRSPGCDVWSWLLQLLMRAGVFKRRRDRETKHRRRQTLILSVGYHGNGWSFKAIGSAPRDLVQFRVSWINSEFVSGLQNRTLPHHRK